MWGLSGFAFNYSPFWNNYFNNPLNLDSMIYESLVKFPDGVPMGDMLTSGGLEDMIHFMTPYNYFGGFYNPYGLGFGLELEIIGLIDIITITGLMIIMVITEEEVDRVLTELQ